jgi:uncharacterized protein YdcH (DUF465 family)
MAKLKNKSLKKLETEYNYYKKKVDEIEQERDWDRSWGTKALLVKLKKMKLNLKTSILNLKTTLGFDR